MVFLLLDNKSCHFLNFSLVIRNCVNLVGHNLIRISDFNLDLLLVIDMIILSFLYIELRLDLLLHLTDVAELDL